MSVRVGLIGAGRMGATLAHHLAFSVDTAVFTAISDPNEAAAQAVAQKCGVPHVYHDYREMLARDDLASGCWDPPCLP